MTLHDPVKMTTISHRIFESLAEQIINGSLTPGQKLDEKMLADKFGVSRTPIREALRELGAKGLVDIVPRRGGVVSQISVEQLADMLEAECEFEGLCARLSAQRMTSLDRGNLMEIHRQLLRLPANKQESTYLALNKEFHDLICAGARNNTITSTARDLRARLMPFRQTQRGTLKERIERSNEEHELIVNSIMSGDPESAYQAMVKHNARLSYGVLRMLREGSAPKA